MSSKRWLSPWKDSLEKPAIYHCISRVVDRRFVFEVDEREQFRMFMRMQENFSGCRVLSYCIISNHFHILLEVPPMPVVGISDHVLLKRLSATNSEAFVAEVAKELAEARSQGRDEWLEEIHARFTYRMHDLSEFMKTLLQRFTRWFNRTHERSGTLWEERYKSVIVESGTAAIQNPRENADFFLRESTDAIKGGISSKRWLSPWKDSLEKPAIYHCI
jgi:REP element-mobilizing transposase RayT